jgi:cobalt-zinc-cadmium efflux system protein
MAHNHTHHHDHGAQATGNIKVAFFLNLFFTVIEIIGGIATNSMAILSDALHDLGDSLSLGLAWYFQNFAKKPKSASYSYGYKRYTLMGALINAVILTTGSIIFVWRAIPRLIEPQEVNAPGMILMALLGIAVNGAAVLRLKNGKSLNQRVVYLHLLEDVLGWVAVLIGAIVMYYFDLPIIDPILSILISLFILFNVYRSLKDINQILMQGTPSEKEVLDVEKYLENLEGILGHHDLHVWSLDGEYHVLTVHLIVDNQTSLKDIVALKNKIRDELHHHGIEHTTLEFELGEEDCDYVDC